MGNVIIQLFGIFAPIVAEIIEKRRQETGETPTNEEIKAEFEANVDKYLAEGADWLTKHPKPPVQ